MKILHTSDWHIGHSLYNYDRTEEHRSMLMQMVDIVRTEQPDLFILAGDVYHTSQPSAAVQTMLAEAIVALHDACPTMSIVMTAGNHDSCSKHEIFRTPWRALGVYAVGQLNKDNPEEHIIAIPGKGFVVAVPYTHERNIPDGFYQQLLDMTAARNGEGLPVVMTAHTTVKGCNFAGHEHATDYTVGGIDSMTLDQLGQGYDYLALGHIHRAQDLNSDRRARYCGTPIPVSFDEDYRHSVTLVDISKHGEKPVVSTVEIDNPRPLQTLPKDGTASWEDAQELLQHFPADVPAYIRLNVEIDDYLPADAKEVAVSMTQGKQCRFCLINAIRKNVSQTAVKVMTVQEFQAEQPIEIAKRYASDTGVEFDEQMQEMFNQVMELMEADLRE